MPDDKTYTAEQLAAAINGELGTKIKARTVYFYRSRDVLSPLEMVGSQPRFNERHRLELKAILALQGTFDRPSLEDIKARLRTLDETQLEQVARLVPPTSGDMVKQATLIGAQPAMTTLNDGAQKAPVTDPCSEAGWETVNVADGVSLHLKAGLPASFVAGLVRRVDDYCRRNLKETGADEDWAPGKKNRYRR